jgi:hypothetical protein
VRLKGYGEFDRLTRNTGCKTIGSDATMINLRRPDLATFDDHSEDRHKNFRYVSAQWELKVAKKNKVAHPLIAQVADAIRLRMASRPFQLFSLAILMCGSRFWVSFWDRDGVVVSKVHDIGSDDFLRVVIALHFDLDLYGLGLDREIVLPTDPATGKAFHYIPSSPCPTTDMAGHKWRLVENLFQSTGSLGRGTSVWLASRDDEDGSLVERAIKWSWRSPGRLSESEIHKRIEADFASQDQPQPATIAIMDKDADTEIPTSVTGIEHTTMTIARLRKDLLPESGPINDLMLTCVVLKRVGKSIWNYDKDSELLRGAHDMLKGK